MERVVVFHFHLFKNAGTSIDAILEKNFGDKLVNKEFKFYPYEENIKQVIEWIKSEEDKIAFSSHTARLFPFELLEKEGIKIIPIIFVRHPIIRIQSAYLFEREKQKNIEALDPVIARNTTLRGYVEIRWHLPDDYQCENFHVHRLSDYFFKEKGDILDKAIKTVELLPVVGLVEEFEKSIKKYEGIIKQYFPKFEAEVVRKNVSFDPSLSVKERLNKIKEEVGEEFYEKMLEKNRADLILWELLRRRYQNG